jgi:hypothetical protein
VRRLCCSCRSRAERIKIAGRFCETPTRASASDTEALQQSQDWDGTVPEQDCLQTAVIRPITLSLSSSACCNFVRLVGTDIALTCCRTNRKENMKPISVIVAKNNRSPLIDCNYRPMTLDGFRGRCVTTRTPRFWNISGQYFQNEARHDFLVEAVCFAIVVITAAVPLVGAANAVVELCRAFAQL